MKKLLFAIMTLAMLSPPLYAQDTSRNSKTDNRGVTRPSQPPLTDTSNSTIDSGRKKYKKKKKYKAPDHIHTDSTNYHR